MRLPEILIINLNRYEQRLDGSIVKNNKPTDIYDSLNF